MDDNNDFRVQATLLINCLPTMSVQTKVGIVGWLMDKAKELLEMDAEGQKKYGKLYRMTYYD